MIVTRVYVGNKEGLSKFDMKYSSSSVYFIRYLHLFSIATLNALLKELVD